MRQSLLEKAKYHAEWYAKLRDFGAPAWKLEAVLLEWAKLLGAVQLCGKESEL